MSKSDLIEHIRESAGMTKADAEAAINAVTSGIISLTAAGQKIRIPNFGQFELKHREARNGRNPQTGEMIRIAARDQLTFKASSKL